MQLIKKMFGRGSGPEPAGESAQFHESETTTGGGSRNAPRRELVHVVLRDSMRRHGIPSAWIDCRILSVVTRNHRTGMHVQLIVRDGVDRLLMYVPAFQTSFMDEIARFDPRVNDWLLSLSWQFHNLNSKVASLMPDPAVWAASTGAAQLAATAPAPIAAPTPLAAPPVATAPTPAPTLPPSPALSARPVSQLPAPASPPAAAPADAPDMRDEEVFEDLQALYAIRDAALRQGRPDAVGPSGEKDFESTHPGGVGPAARPPHPSRW